jgi:hypothetical protein
MNGNPSFPWARPTALPKQEALRGLRKLKDGCTAEQIARRRTAFQQAERFINANTVQDTPLSRTFKNRNLPKTHKDARVDIEVFAGIAFL